MSRSVDPGQMSANAASGPGVISGTSLSAPMSVPEVYTTGQEKLVPGTGPGYSREENWARQQGAPDMPTGAPAAPPSTIQGRPVNPDGTITGANGGTQQLGNAAMRRLGMEPGGPPAAPPGLKGFRRATPYGSDEMARPLDGNAGAVDARPDLAGALMPGTYPTDLAGALGGNIVNPDGSRPSGGAVDVPLPTSFRRRRPDFQGGGGALGGF